MKPILSFDDILLVPTYNDISSRKEVDTSVQLKDGLFFNIPIISSNMDTITESEMANTMTELGGMAILHRFCSIEKNIEIFNKCKNKRKIGISIGISDTELIRAHKLIKEAGAYIICVDVAHGHSKRVGEAIKELKDNYGDSIYIIAGNVVTIEGAKFLMHSGADMIKIGVGPGSACSTRIKTGFGFPQLGAIQECATLGVPIIADGGIRKPADMVKALWAGASMVMIGGMLSGTKETPGELYGKYPDQYKRFRGMASKEAQDEFLGAMSEWKTSEGVETIVKYKGFTKDVISDLMGGLRSGMTYCGAKTIKELRENAKSVIITNAGLDESWPHILDKK